MLGLGEKLNQQTLNVIFEILQCDKFHNVIS